MKYLILVDEKPESCVKCPFWVEDLHQTNSNTFNIVENCLFTKEDFKTCPLTVANTIFEVKKQNE